MRIVRRWLLPLQTFLMDGGSSQSPVQCSGHTNVELLGFFLEGDRFVEWGDSLTPSRKREKRYSIEIGPGPKCTESHECVEVSVHPYVVVSAASETRRA